jgi:hypothetical protein
MMAFLIRFSGIMSFGAFTELKIWLLAKHLRLQCRLT